MRVHSKMIRILGAAAVAAAVLTTVTSAFATPSGPAAARATFAVRGNIAGGITTIQTGQTLTYVFTEVNRTTAGAIEDLHLTRVNNVSVTAMTCVVPGGSAIDPDSPFCEPGLVNPGERAAMVVTTTVTGDSGTASARVCLTNEDTGATGPCKTVSVTIA
jgi:hypothetical protein